MFKIYPDEYVKKQIIIENEDLDLKREIIFTLSEKHLNIDYVSLHIKILKTDINKVKITKYNNENLILNIKWKMDLGYIYFSKNINYKNIYDFFEEFGIQKSEII